MSTNGQGTKRRRNIVENLSPVSRAQKRCRLTTDGRAIAYSEREREFTFAKKGTRLTSKHNYTSNINVSFSRCIVDIRLNVYHLVGPYENQLLQLLHQLSKQW